MSSARARSRRADRQETPDRTQPCAAVEQRNIAAPLMQRKIYSATTWGLSRRSCRCKGISNRWRLPSQGAGRRRRGEAAFDVAQGGNGSGNQRNQQAPHGTQFVEGNPCRRRSGDADEINPRPGYRQADLHQHGGRRRQTRRSNHEIVPLDDTLLVEAGRPADVAFLHPGQKAMVKISAYDFSIYGGLRPILKQISAGRYD